MDYYLAIKKNGILIHATEFMNFEKVVWMAQVRREHHM